MNSSIVHPYFLAATSLAVAVLLAACGGRDDDSAAKPAAAVNYSQDDVKAVAALGTTLPVITADRSVTALAVMAADLVSLSAVFTGAAASGTVNCDAGGTWTYKVSKSAAGIGFAIGDKLIVNYANCSSSADADFADGGYTLTATNAISNLSVDGSFDTRFNAEISNFRTRLGTVTHALSGNAAVAVISNGDPFTARFSIPSGSTLSIDSAGTNFSYGGGASATFTHNVTPGLRTAKLDGPVTVTTTDARLKTHTMTLSTTKELTGPASSETFVPTTGTIEIRASVAPTFDKAFTGTTTISGSAIGISADSDGDGAMDTTISTTWAGLEASIPGGIKVNTSGFRGTAKAAAATRGSR